MVVSLPVCTVCRYGLRASDWVLGAIIVWYFLEEKDATAVMGQSRGTRPIMYLLLERWERRKPETEMRGAMAEMAMGTGLRKTK